MRTAAQLPVRELGYQEFANRAPNIGLGEEGATTFIRSISFEDCAARCGDDCVGIVRRNTGANCWLVPASAYPGADLASNLQTWSGGTTYAKLSTCESDPTVTCTEIWGVPCTCEDYAVQNTFVHGQYEYATLDDAPPQPEQCLPRWDPDDAAACADAVDTATNDDPAARRGACHAVGADGCTSSADRCRRCQYTERASSTTYGGRCPNDQPNCAGSTCANGMSGQNYFLRMPCGWDFFRLFTEPEAGSRMELDDIEIWENVVTVGWGTSCVNDVFSGAALWSTGPSAGYDDSTSGGDYQCTGTDCQIMNECGQMHPPAVFSAATQSYRSWYTEFSPVAGFRSLSCGRRFLIRRSISCAQPDPSTAPPPPGCVDSSDTDIAVITSAEPLASRRVGSCAALTGVLLASGDTCDEMVGPAGDRRLIWDLCCASCERRFGVRPDRQVAATSVTHALRLDPDESPRGLQPGNWAVDEPGTVVIPLSSQPTINDGLYGNSNAWSGSADASGTISVGYAFTSDYAESSVVLVDAIAFGRDNSQSNRYHNNYAGAYTIQISQYSATVPADAERTQETFEQVFSSGLHDAEACVQPVVDGVPSATLQDCAAVAVGNRDSQQLCEYTASGEASGCVYRGQWETLDTLIYDAQSPDYQPWKRHYYRLTPPVPLTAIRIVTSSPSIVIDEFEVYGARTMSPDWVPDQWEDNRLLPVPSSTRVGPGVVVTDSTHATNAIQLLNIQRANTEELPDATDFRYPTCRGLASEPEASQAELLANGCQANWPSKGAEVVAQFEDMQIIYEVAFRSESVAQSITTCKISFVDRDGVQQFVTANSISTNPADAVNILAGEVLTDCAKDGGHTVPLPVPIETNHVRFYGIDGAAGGEAVQVQFGLSGAPASNVQMQTTKPQLDVDIDAQGFDATVGCDEVTYAVTVRHKIDSAGAPANSIRITDMLSDPKLRLIPGRITVEKRMDTDADWTLMDAASGGFRVISGNDDGNDVVMVDVNQLFNGQVLRLSYAVRVLEPEPLDIISSMAVVELLSAEQASQCRDGGDQSSAGGALTRERLIAHHTLESDVGSLSFDAAVSHGNSTTPYEVSIDGRTDSVFMINLDIAVLLSAGTAQNVLLRLEVPEDRQQYFELLSVDSLDNTGSRTATSDDTAVLNMGEFQVLTESITVPCSSDETDNTAGLELSLTGALYNSFYYSTDYTCQLEGCSELSVRAVLEYDLVSNTLFHDRFSDERLFNTTRSRGVSLPAVSIEDLGVHYRGGHPTWPLFTVQLDNKELPSGDGSSYEGKISIEGSFEGMEGRLSVIVSGGVDEFYITRNPLRNVRGQSSFGTIGRIVTTEKQSSDGEDWDLNQVLTSSSIELRIKVTETATFLTGTIDGHVVTTVYDDANIVLGDAITISVFKELQTDDITVRSVDASFVCVGECTVRHTESRNIQIARPGAPPNDIMLQSVIQTGQCADVEQFGYDACVTERAVEGTQVASISVTDADWSIGDTYRYEIVDQSAGEFFRLSSDLASRNNEVFLEVAGTIPEFYDQQQLTVLLTVRDNLWLDHFFTKLVTVRVLAYPMRVSLQPSINADSAYVVPELTAAGVKLADIVVEDPDAVLESTVTFAISGDDAGLFELDGAELLVASSAPLPGLVEQSFFDIFITATDWNGLEYQQLIELTSSDVDECLTEGTPEAVCSDTATCLNSVGSYRCLCPDGSLPTNADASACEEVLECEVDNGSCGDPTLVTCEERTYDAVPSSCTSEQAQDPDPCPALGGSAIDCAAQTGCVFTAETALGFGFECVDIDECVDVANDPSPNGGCGDPAHVQCVNQHAAPPTCEDACECPSACDSLGTAFPAFCTDLDQQASGCASPTWDGAVTAGTPVSIEILNNADLSTIEAYAIKTSSVGANVRQAPDQWSTISVDVVDSPSGCVSTDPSCQLTASFTPTTTGRYYFVVKNQGRNMQGSPFQFDVVAAPTIETVQVSGDGLRGGAATAGDTLRVIPVDSLNNVIEAGDLSAQLTSGLTITVTNNNPAATPPAVSNRVVSRSTQPDGTVVPGAYELSYSFSARAAGSTYTVIVSWNGQEVARTDNFRAVGGANLIATNVDYSKTTFEIVKPGVAGTTAGVVHMQMRDVDGSPLIAAPCNPTCADIFEVSVEGPLAAGQIVTPRGTPQSEGLTLQLSAIGGIVQGVLRISDSKFAEVAGKYTVTVTCIPGGGPDTPPELGNRCPMLNSVAVIVFDVAAAAIQPVKSSVVATKGPYPAAPTPSGRTGLAGELLSLGVVPRDRYGNDAMFEDIDTRIKAKATSQDTFESITVEFGTCSECNTSCVAGMISRDPDGSYTLTYMLKQAGLYEISAEIDGTVVDGMPFGIKISPAAATTFSSTTMDGHMTGSAGQALSIPLIFADANGNFPAFPPASTLVQLTHRDDPTVVLTPPIQSDLAGGLVAVVTFARAGDYTLEVQVADPSNDNQMTSFWSEGLVQILPAAGATGEVAQVQNGVAVNLGPGGDGTLMQLVAGILNELQIATFDEFGNAATGGSQVTAVLASIIPGVYSQTTVATYAEGEGYTIQLDVPPSAYDIPTDIQLRVYVNTVQVFLAKVEVLAPVTCTVPATQDVLSADEQLSVSIEFENYPVAELAALVAADGVAVQLTHTESGVVLQGATAAPVGGTVSATAEIQAAGVYSVAVVHKGRTELCEPRTPFITVVPAAPAAGTSALATTVGTGTVTVGESFGFTITSMDAYNNPIKVDPFNVLWEPIVVTLVDHYDAEFSATCIQRAPGEPLPEIDTRYDLDADGQPVLDSECYVDAREAGVAVISRPGSYSVVAVTADGTQLPGSDAVFTVSPVVVDPDWDIRKPRQYEAYAGSPQEVSLSIRNRLTGVYITASQVAVASMVNMEISASCCAICSCQDVARVPAVVTQSVDNQIRIRSSELHRVGTYAIQVEHAVSGEVIFIPSVFTLAAGTPVAALYSLMTPWPDTVKAGATTSFTLMANDVFSNPTGKGGDLISANALYCTAQPNLNEAVTCVTEALRPEWIAAGDVADNDDGTYTVSYRPTLSGDYEVQVVRMGDGPIPHHPWRVRVEPGGVDPSQTTIDVTELLTNAAIDLQVKDAFGNAIVENDPGVAFSYTWDFTAPHLDCARFLGGDGETCIYRTVASISANRNEAANIANAIDGEARPDSALTWLTSPDSDHTAVEVTLELQTAGPIDRLRVVTFPDESIENEELSAGRNTVAISIYTSLDGIEWVAVAGLIDGYLGTETLPDGAFIDPDGPSVGASHLENLERYAPAWSVMFSSRFAKYIRLDISSAPDSPVTKYPVREIQVADCRCVHSQAGNSGMIVYQEEFNGYKEMLALPGAIDEPYTFDRAGVLTLSVMFGLTPIRYEPGFTGEPYVHLVGGQTDDDSDETACVRFYAAEVAVACSEDYCTPGCFHAYNQWHSGEATDCNRYANQDYLGIQQFCERTSIFDSTAFSPSLVVPGDSPGLSDGILAGELAKVEMLFSDPHGKIVAGTSQWVYSDQVDVVITGPDGEVPVAVRLTFTGAAMIEFTPVEVGEHSIVVSKGAEVLLAKLVMVGKGRPPNMSSAKFTSDGSAVQLAFDAPISNGQGSIDCNMLLRSSSLLLLAGEGSKPVCKWLDEQTVSIVLGFGATIVPGDAIEILPGMISRVDVESQTAQGAMHVKHPDVGEVPSFCLPETIDIGNCESLNVRPSCIGGDGGRGLTFEYVIHKDHRNDQHLDDQAVPVDDTLQNVADADGDLYLGPGTFKASTAAAPVSTEFFVRATNFLGYTSAESSVIVTRSDRQRLPVAIDGDKELRLFRDEFLYLQGGLGTTEPDVNSPRCVSVTGEVTYTWQQVVDGDDAPHVVDFENGGSVDQGGGQQPYLYIRAGILRPGVKYTFRLRGTGSAGASGFVNGHDMITVTVKERNLVAKIAGCDRTIDVNGPSVTLDALTSFDPDTREHSLVGVGERTIQTLFRWTCVTYPVGNPSSAGPCMQKSAVSEALSIAPQMQVPAGDMTVGNIYEFTVDLSALSVYSGVKKASATVSIEPVDSPIPQVSITPPFSRRTVDGAYVTKANDQIVILANGDTSGMEYRWTFVQGGTALPYTWTQNRALTLPAGSLTPGQACLLQVEGRVRGVPDAAIGKSTVRFVVQDAPSGGIVALSMNNIGSRWRVGYDSLAGVSLVTDYTFRFTGWAKAKAFRLAYKDCSGVDEDTGEAFCVSNKFSMTSRIPSITTKLTSAYMKASTGTITVDAVVFDEYGSTATYSLDIAIEPNNFVCSELSATREAVSNDLRLAQLGNFYQIATAEWTKANCNRAGADEVQRQVRWATLTTAGNVSCTPEVQQHVRRSGWTQWSAWETQLPSGGEFQCTQTETRVMFDNPSAGNGCSEEVQTRTRTNNQEWSPWTGPGGAAPVNFEPVCATAETRVAWKRDQTSDGELCEKAQQYRVGVNNGDPSAWDGLYDTVGDQYTFEQCTETEERIGYERAEPLSGTEFARNECVEEVQTRSRINIAAEDAGDDNSGGWSPWSGEVTECTETQTRWRFREGYGAACEPEQQTRTRVLSNGRVLGDGWSQYSGSYNYLSCIVAPSDPTTATTVQQFTVNNAELSLNVPPQRANGASGFVVTQTGERVRYAAALAFAPEQCIAQTQTRTTGEDGEWGPWSGSFVYVSCAEVDLVDLYQTERAETCVGRTGVRTRECADGTCETAWTPPVDPNTGSAVYSGDYTASICTVFETQQTFAASGFAVPEEMARLPTSSYACDALDQEREYDSSTDTWGEWSGVSRPFADCSFETTRVRWAAPVTVTGEAGLEGCVSEVQKRRPVVSASGERTWTPWTGTYRYEHCTERQSRYRYGISRGVGSSVPAGECLSTKIVERRWRTDGSAWFGDAFLTERTALANGPDVSPFPFDDCRRALPQQRVAYREARPADSETGCVRQFQTRSRTDAWEAWDSGPNEDEVFTELLCLVEEQRTRWRSMPDGCQSEVQSRYKDGNDDWSDWTGEFTDETCTDTRIRFSNREVGDGYTFPDRCTGVLNEGQSNEQQCAETDAFVADPTATNCPVGCTFLAAVNPQCNFEEQTMTGSQDADGQPLISWSGTYVHDTCEEIERATKWSSPVSWDGPCESSDRTRRRAAVVRDDGTQQGTYVLEWEMFGPFSEPLDYVYDSCTQYESRERFSAPDGDPSVDNVCISETQIRSCVDCDEAAGRFEWSQWSGTYIYPLCIRSLSFDGSGFRPLEDVQQRRQFQYQTGRCERNETQVRVRLPEDGQPGTQWTPWSGDFVYAFCPFSGEIQEREAWMRASVDTPEVCVSEAQTRYSLGADSWTAWFGDFRYTECTETETALFYQDAVVVNGLCVEAQQTRSRTNNGDFSDWSGEFVESNCTEVEERVRFEAPLATDGDVCLRQLQNRSRFPNGVWSEWSGDDLSYTEDTCTEIQERTRWEASATAGDCVSEQQFRTRTDGGVISQWNGTYQFATCQQNEERTMYDAAVAPAGLRCTSEIQTRDRYNNAQWSEWSGNPLVFNYSSCVPGAPTVETRIRWREQSVVGGSCRSEVQQRTVRADDPDTPEDEMNPPWGGTFEFSACTEVQERYRFMASTATSCEFERQTRSAPGTSRSWGEWTGEQVLENCTETRYMWAESDDLVAPCQAEQQTRLVDETLSYSTWSGSFNETTCRRVEQQVRWRQSAVECASEQFGPQGRMRNPSSSNPTRDCGQCQSEVVTRSRPANPDNTSGGFSSWSGEVEGRAPYVFDECTETDVRRRYQFAARNGSFDSGTGGQHNGDNENCMLASEAQTRSRTNRGLWSSWSGTLDFVDSECSNLPFETESRIRWYKPNTENEPCIYETQVRNRNEWTGNVWGEWSGSYVFESCTEFAVSQRYATQESVDTPCRESAATRERTDGGAWTEWQSEFNYTTCLQTEFRTAWQAAEIDGLAQNCRSEYQTRYLQLPDTNGVGMSPWRPVVGDHLALWTEPHCVQRESRMKWLSPVESTNQCQGQTQTRTRIDNGEWGCWDGTYAFDECVQTQRRRRYSVQAAAVCQAEVQERQSFGRSSLTEFTEWSGQTAVNADGVTVRVYEREDCVQPGLQTQTRDRYRDDGVCTYERQSRSRSNGGQWSAWQAQLRDGTATEPLATLESCVEIESRFRYVSINNMCMLTETLNWREGSPTGEAGWTTLLSGGC